MIVIKKLYNIIFVYSINDIIEEYILVCSVINPATNSDSASIKSNGIIICDIINNPIINPII
jgi:hypothetical protein